VALPVVLPIKHRIAYETNAEKSKIAQDEPFGTPEQIAAQRRMPQCSTTNKPNTCVSVLRRQADYAQNYSASGIDSCALMLFELYII
jgi:hypothetical protein